MIWVDFIRLAEELVRVEEEASRRSGISRAYYGVFNLARRWLEARGTKIEDRRAHGQVWLAFNRAAGAAPDSRRKWQEIGDLGGAMRRLRNQADYADHVSGLERLAVESVDSAKQILALLDELAPGD
jgi:uncharacterized protein (UPF0332 family)